MTVVRLGGGRLWLHSPFRPGEALTTELDRIGRDVHHGPTVGVEEGHVQEDKARRPSRHRGAHDQAQDRDGDQIVGPGAVLGDGRDAKEVIPQRIDPQIRGAIRLHERFNVRILALQPIRDLPVRRAAPSIE